MSAAKLADVIQSAQLKRTSLKRGWLKIDLGGLVLRSIEIHGPHNEGPICLVEQYSRIVGGKTYHPFNFQSGEFKEFLLRLVARLWNETQEAAKEGQIPYTVYWSADTPG